jgi:hypothetical protein
MDQGAPEQVNGARAVVPAVGLSEEEVYKVSREQSSDSLHPVSPLIFDTGLGNR